MGQRGRPKQYDGERVVTAVRLPKALLRDLKMTAIAQETSVNELVTRATAQLLEKEGVEVVPRVRQENAAVG